MGFLDTRLDTGLVVLYPSHHVTAGQHQTDD
jgi:hypothetical protein